MDDESSTLHVWSSGREIAYHESSLRAIDGLRPGKNAIKSLTFH